MAAVSSVKNNSRNVKKNQNIERISLSTNGACQFKFTEKTRTYKISNKKLKNRSPSAIKILKAFN